MLRLTPVIELQPCLFGPGVPGRRADEPFDSYWLRALAHLGVEGLRPRGGCHAALDDLIEPIALELVLDVHLDRLWNPGVGSTHGELLKALPGGVADLVDALSGGFELIADGGVLSFPGCCADLADITSWESAAACTSAAPEMLWIGHPWQAVRLNEGMLELYGPNETLAGPLVGRVAPSSLGRAIRDARDSVSRFAERLSPIVQSRFGAAKGPAIVRCMIGR